MRKGMLGKPMKFRVTDLCWQTKEQRLKEQQNRPMGHESVDVDP